MDTTTNTTANTSIFTSGPHVPVKLLPFDSKQPKRWFQQTDAIFRWSHIVLLQTKWHDWMYAGPEYCKTGGMQDMRNRQQDGCRT